MDAPPEGANQNLEGSKAEDVAPDGAGDFTGLVATNRPRLRRWKLEVGRPVAGGPAPSGAKYL